jgi:hypothetical protein
VWVVGGVEPLLLLLVAAPGTAAGAAAAVEVGPAAWGVMGHRFGSCGPPGWLWTAAALQSRRAGPGLAAGRNLTEGGCALGGAAAPRCCASRMQLCISNGDVQLLWTGERPLGNRAPRVWDHCRKLLIEYEAALRRTCTPWLFNTQLLDESVEHHAVYHQHAATCKQLLV